MKLYLALTYQHKDEELPFPLAIGLRLLLRWDILLHI